MLEIEEVIVKATDGREWHLGGDIFFSDVQIVELRDGGAELDLLLSFKSTELYEARLKDLVDAIQRKDL